MGSEETSEATDLRTRLLEEAEPVAPPNYEAEDVKRTSREEQNRIRNTGLAQFFGLRVIWSRWLIGWISLLIAFQIILTLAIGLQALDFTGFETFLQLTVGQNFLQVIGLAMIVVRFLHQSKEAKDRDPPPV